MWNIYICRRDSEEQKTVLWDGNQTQKCLESAAASFFHGIGCECSEPKGSWAQRLAEAVMKTIGFRLPKVGMSKYKINIKHFPSLTLSEMCMQMCQSCVFCVLLCARIMAFNLDESRILYHPSPKARLHPCKYLFWQRLLLLIHSRVSLSPAPQQHSCFSSCRGQVCSHCFLWDKVPMAYPQLSILWQGGAAKVTPSSTNRDAHLEKATSLAPVTDMASFLNSEGDLIVALLLHRHTTKDLFNSRTNLNNDL